MKKLIKKIKILFQRFRDWQCRRMLKDILTVSPNIFNKYIEDKSTELALKMVMKFLDNEHILHCSFCPQRFGLQNIGNYRACKKHTEHARKIEEEKTKKRAA